MTPPLSLDTSLNVIADGISIGLDVNLYTVAIHEFVRLSPPPAVGTAGVGIGLEGLEGREVEGEHGEGAVGTQRLP
jgi:hypothetical protein